MADSGPVPEFEWPDEPVPEPAEAESSREEPLSPLGIPDEDLLLPSFSDISTRLSARGNPEIRRLSCHLYAR